MARGVFSTANHFLYTGGLIAATPLTMAAWVYPTSVSVVNSIGGIFYTGGALALADGWRMRINGTTGVPSFITGNGITSAAVNHTTAVTLNAWNHLAGITASATSRYVYIGGVASTQNTDNITPTAPLDKTAIGVIYEQNNGVQQPATANYIAEVGFWNVALTTAEILQLAAGYSAPFVRPESLVAYYPLIRGDASGDEPDLMGGLEMVEQGTVGVKPHCRVFYVGRHRVLGKTVSAVALAVADTSHAHSADNVALTQHQVLAVADASHAQSADNVALTQHQVLTVADASHAHAADNVALTQHHALAIYDAHHVQTADNVILGGVPTALMVQDAHHIQIVDSVTLCRDYFLFILFIALSHVTDGYIARSMSVIGHR